MFYNKCYKFTLTYDVVCQHIKACFSACYTVGCPLHSREDFYSLSLKQDNVFDA